MTSDALRRVLDGQHAAIRDRVREGLSRPEFAPVVTLDRSEYRERILTQARILADEGGTALGYPREYGGEGNVGGAIAAFETMAHGDLSLLVKCGVQFGLFGGAVLHLGTERHHRRYLADIASLALPGCFAMTETGHGSDVQSLETTATYDPDSDGFVIDTPHAGARKDYIGNAATHGRLAVVFAQLRVADKERGVHALVVPIRDAQATPCPGVTIEDCGAKAGLEGVDNGRLRFSQVHVPRDALLDRYGTVDETGQYHSPIENRTRRFFTMLGTLVQGRISVAGAAVAASKTALCIAVRYAERRRQFGPPGDDREVLLLDYLAHQRRLLPAIATTYALHFAQQTLIDDLDRIETSSQPEQAERRQLESRAAGIKALATWHATATIQESREACGGAGYLSINRLGTLKADTDVFTTFEGDNTVLLQLVAKGLLTNYRDEFGGLDLLGTVRFVAEEVVETIIERTAARRVLRSLLDAVSNDEEEDLRDPVYHRRLFAWREEHVLTGVARRLKAAIDAGDAPFDAFNRCQDHVLLAARVHIERVVLDATCAAVEDCRDDDARPLLAQLCDLHALSSIERDRAWFLEHGRLTATRAKMVIAAVNDLCAALRPHARVLVDAFAIPEQQLAPIAVDHATVIG